MRIGFTYSKRYPIQSRQGRIISTIMLIAGLLFCIFGLYKSSQYARQEDRLVSVTARIERIEVTGRGDRTRHDVYVSYTHEGKEYRDIHLNWYTSSMKEGKTLTLKVDPSDPAVPIGNHGPIILLAGGIQTLIAAILWVASRWDRLRGRFGRKRVEP